MAASLSPLGGGRDCAGGVADGPASAGGGGWDGTAAPYFPDPHIDVIRHRVGDEWRIEVHVAGRSAGIMLNLTLAEAEVLAAKVQRLARLQPGLPAEVAHHRV